MVILWVFLMSVSCFGTQLAQNFRAIIRTTIILQRAVLEIYGNSYGSSDRNSEIVFVVYKLFDFLNKIIGHNSVPNWSQFVLLITYICAPLPELTDTYNTNRTGMDLSSAVSCLQKGKAMTCTPCFINSY